MKRQHVVYVVRSDTRLGAQLQTVSCDFQKVFQMHDKLFVGLTGLGSDVQTMYAVSLIEGVVGRNSHALLPLCRHEHLRFRVNMYKYKEERDIAPETFMNMVCSMQYAKRCVLASLVLLPSCTFSLFASGSALGSPSPL